MYVKSRRLASAVVVAILTVLAAVTAGCGNAGASAEQKAKAQASASQEAAAKARQKAAAAKKARQSAVYEECRKVAGTLDDRLSELNSRLSVGVPFAEYGKAVGSAKVAYDKFIRDAKAQGGVSDACINKVGIPLESALNAYIRAYQVWNDCIDEYSCSFDKGSPALKKAQASWAKAARLMSRADNGLAGLEPAP